MNNISNSLTMYCNIHLSIVGHTYLELFVTACFNLLGGYELLQFLGVPGSFSFWY